MRDARDNAPSSRLPGYFRLPLHERLALLQEQGRLDAEDLDILRSSAAGLPLEVANTMIENVIGVYGLPIGLGLNFLVNGRDYVVPLVVEEPSIVAAVSHTARIVRDAGGFHVDADPPLMIGQVQIVGCPDPHAAEHALRAHRQELLDLANSFHPSMVERGGGAQDIEIRILHDTAARSRFSTMVVLHLLIHTCDAMGANLINTMAEGIADRVEALSGGRVFLRILSNLASRRMVRARCAIPCGDLAWKGFSGQEVAEGIALASRFAELDPWRAATHNKGVMNGIDAVAIATGNDWRAIEAGAHAWAALEDGYRPFAVWTVEDDHLVGRLEIPLAVGTVGGPIKLHPTLRVLYKLLNVSSAQELAAVMGAVGLAQNLGALKALATEGIQPGHMSLHARSVAATAGVPPHLVEQVAQRLVAEGNIRVERARDIAAALQREAG